MKQKVLILSLLTAIVLALGACATANKGTTQTVLINTQPQGSAVYVNGELLPKLTPLHVELARGNSYTVDIRKDGYESVSAVLMPIPNQYEGNMFRWGLDYQTGAMTDLQPSEINLTLKKSGEEDKK